MKNEIIMKIMNIMKMKYNNNENNNEWWKWRK